MEKGEYIKQLRLEYTDICDELDERRKRLWCGAKARSYNREHGRGGVTLVYRALGISRSCIYAGIKEITESQGKSDRIRKQGGGRKKN